MKRWKGRGRGARGGLLAACAAVPAASAARAGGPPGTPEPHLMMIAALLLLLLSLAGLLAWAHIRSRRLRKTLYFDELTGLHSRRGFEKEVPAALRRAPPGTCRVLYAANVNYFKVYNALHGFAAGDRLLRLVADALREGMRPGELCARFNADHFAGLAFAEDLDAFLRRLEEIHGLVRSRTGNPALLISFGVYEIRDAALNVATMYDMATEAKRAAKGNYVNNVGVYNGEMFRQRMENAALVTALDGALAAGEFAVYYQPKYDAHTDGIAGAEALVRWVGRDGRLRMPGQFIAVFEKSGQIQKLDLHIFERVCAFLEAQRAAGRETVPVSVNFSRTHLYEREFPRRLADIARRHNVPCRLLEVELTETAFLEHAELLLQAIDALHGCGFTVSIDDFGSGYSSLNMLKDTPADTLKIDLKFMEGFESGGRAGTVVASILRMAKWLGITVVAEGVETAEQAVFLRSMGCDLMQGYYYAKPMPEAEFRGRLAEAGAAAAPAYEPLEYLADINAVMGGDQLVTRIMDTVFDGVGIFELTDGRLEAIRVNDPYFQILGYRDHRDFDADSFDVLKNVPEDRRAEVVRTCLLPARERGEAVRGEVPCYHRDGRLLRLKVLCRYLGGSGERPIFFIALMDRTDGGG